MKLRPVLVVVLPLGVLLFLGWWQSHLKETRSARLGPVHKPLRPPTDPVVLAVLEDAAALRAGPPDAAVRLARIKSAAPETLHYLELRILDRKEPERVRVDLLGIVAAQRDEATRRLLGRLAADSTELEAVRQAAFRGLGAP